MKKLRLRKWIEILLYIINFLIMMFILAINDFDLIGFIILMLLFYILAFNTYILYKFGRIKWKMKAIFLHFR